MDIKVALNTPALVKKILGSSTFSSSENGSIDNQTVVINSDSSSFINNSPITITDIKTYYSDLGILKPQSDTVPVNNLNILNLQKNTYDLQLPSVVETVPEIKKLYDEIAVMLKNSIEADDYVLKETFLLLSLKKLIYMNYTFIIFFSEWDNLNFSISNNNLISMINLIQNILLSVCRSLKYLYIFIGQTSLNKSYTLKITNELKLSVTIFINFADTLKSNYSFNSGNKKILQSVISSFNDIIKKLSSFEDKIPLVSDLFNIYSTIINAIDSILNIISSYGEDMFKYNFVNFISLLRNANNIIEYTVSAINSANTDIRNSYSLIVSYIQSALSALESTDIIQDKIKLLTDLNTKVLLKKSSSKIFSTDNNNNSALHKADTINPGENSISKTVQLELSLYVYDLNISITGTIGSNNFNGYIYYPHLYNLSFFGIQNIAVNTNIEINEKISSFNISQCLNAKLQAISVIPDSDYSTTTPDSFSASISLELTLNDEIIVTAVFPMVLLK